jgi:hypothetical protein
MDSPLYELRCQRRKRSVGGKGVLEEHKDYIPVSWSLPVEFRQVPILPRFFYDELCDVFIVSSLVISPLYMF